MSKIKKFLALALSAGISLSAAFGFAGCISNDNDPSKNPVDPKPPVVLPDPDDKEDQAKKDFKAAVEKFQAFATSLQAKKFACDKSDENIVVCENIIKINDVYYEKVGDTQYQYVLGNDNQYHKTVYDAEKNVDHFKQLDNALSRFGAIEWKTLSESKVLTGIYMGQSVTYHTNDGNHNMTFDDQTSQYHDIGKTTQLPENVIDDTKAPVESNKLYDEQGNLNYPLFAKTIKDWMNDGYLSNKLLKPMQGVINDIDYISTNEIADKITFGAYINVSLAGKTTNNYQMFTVESESLMNKLINAEFDNANDLTNYLNSLTDKPITLGTGSQYESTTQYAKAQEKENLFTMAENILARLHEVGYQGASINNEGTKVTDYDGATVLSVRKDKDTGGNSSLDMGTVYHSDIYVTIERENGNQEILTFGVSYSTSGASQNICDEDITSKSWIIREYSSKGIDYCTSTENTAQYAFVLDDDAYLIR